MFQTRLEKGGNKSKSNEGENNSSPQPSVHRHTSDINSIEQKEGKTVT